MSSTLAPRRPTTAMPKPAVRPGMLEEAENLFGRLWEEAESGWFFGRNAPLVDISETDSTIEAKVDLPGVKAKEINIQLHGNVMTISGERQEEKDDKGKTFHRVERRSGSFSRSFSLPCPIEEDEVAAGFHDGVLTITLPKTEEAKTRKIAVKS